MKKLLPIYHYFKNMNRGESYAHAHALEEVIQANADRVKSAYLSISLNNDYRKVSNMFNTLLSLIKRVIYYFSDLSSTL